jgi:hypothetical protein
VDPVTVSRLQQYREDPVAFVREVMDIELTPAQVETVQAFVSARVQEAHDVGFRRGLREARQQESEQYKPDGLRVAGEWGA